MSSRILSPSTHVTRPSKSQRAGNLTWYTASARGRSIFWHVDPRGNRPAHRHAALGAVEAAILALLGLLLAFTFSGAGASFDWRRHLIVKETNAIGTAYLRLEILPAGAQPALR